MNTKKSRRFSLPSQKLESLKEHAEQKALEATKSSDVTTDIALNKLYPAPWNARRYFDETSLHALGEDLRINTQIHPILVRPKEGGFEIVVGERRYRAAMLVNLPTLKATVRELDDATAQRLSLAENLGREDLNTFEETVGYLQFLSLELSISPDFTSFRQVGEGDESAVRRLLYSLFGKKQRGVNNVINEAHLVRLEKQIEEAFLTIGTMSWTSFVQNRLPILELPDDVLEVIRSGKLAYTKGRLIAKVEDGEHREQLLREVLEKGLSGAQIRQHLAALKDKDRGEVNLQKRATVVAKALKNQSLLKDEKIRKQAEKLLSQLEDLLALRKVSK